MKVFHHLILFILLIGQNIALSQNLETVFSRGYNSHVADMGRLSDGRWVLAVQDSPIPGGIYKDTISVRIIDSTGALEKLITISPPNEFENFSIDHLLVLPLDEFLVSYSGGDCDAGGYAYYVEKFDSLGQSKWSIQLPEYFHPSQYGIGLDSNILVGSNDEILKISSDNGTVIWLTESPGLYFNEMIFVPGSEDVIISDEDGLKYFQQDLIQGDVFYSLKASEDIPHEFGSIGRFQTSGDGIFYAYKYYDKEIIRFRSNLKAKLYLTLTESFIDMSPKPGGLVLLRKNDLNTYKISYYDSSGVKISEHISADSGLKPTKMKCFPEGLGLAGSYGSGPNSSYNPDYHYTGRGQGWFRYFPQYNYENNPQPVSLSVTDIIQQEFIHYDSAWSSGYPYSGYFHSFSGGNFRLKITNTGSDPVHSFWANIAFDQIHNVWFCPPIAVKHLYFEVDTLRTDESIWIEFGDIEAYNQHSIPSQFCFWTSGNNSLPDYLPQDDVFCMDRIVQTHEASEESFIVYPNPVDSEINIISSLTTPSDWEIRDILGRKVLTGLFDPGSSIESIPVTSIPSGVYFFRIDHFSKKIMIQH